MDFLIVPALDVHLYVPALIFLIMTLGIAMRTPWGAGRDLEPHVREDIHFPPGIVLVSDSRFSFGNRRSYDRGAKIWMVSTGVAAILAGAVTPAEAGLYRAKRIFAGHAAATVDQAADVLADALRHSTAKALPKGMRVSILVGVSSLDGDAKIVRLESPSFHPSITIEDQFIGQEYLSADVYKMLQDRTSLAFSGHQIGNRDGAHFVVTPDDLAGPLAGVLSELATAQNNHTVGGNPQVVVVQDRKVVALRMDRLDPVTSTSVQVTNSYDSVFTTDGHSGSHGSRKVAQMRKRNFRR